MNENRVSRRNKVSRVGLSPERPAQARNLGIEMSKRQQKIGSG